MIRRIDALTGIITTIAGNGTQGYSGDNGPPLNATFYRPTDLSFDAKGNLYIADARNSAIRKISLCPTVSLGTDKTICQASSLLLDAGNNFTQFEWSTGAATQTIQINTPGMYWVKAAHSATCITKDTIVVTQHPALQFGWPADTGLCVGTSLVINTPAGTTVKQWQDGSVSPTYTITDTGKYWVTVADQHNCINADTLVVDKAFSPPADFLEKEITYCWYDSFSLKPKWSFPSYLWSNGSTTATTTVDQEGAYWLQVTNQHHCIGKDTIVVKLNVDCKLGIYFYNAFTPNNDGKNDIFKPAVEGALLYYNMVIYNRWGQKVFETNDWKKGWTGNFNNYPQPAGVYVYNITYQLPRSTRKNQKGTVMLIR